MCIYELKTITVTCDSQRSPICAYLNQNLNALLRKHRFSIFLQIHTKLNQRSINSSLSYFATALANFFVHKQSEYNEYF